MTDYGHAQSDLILFVVLEARCIRQPAQVQHAEFTGQVVGVIDEDTIEVSTLRVVATRVRMNGIDALEPRQSFGTEAKEHLSELIDDQPVRVIDVGEDQYGPTLGDKLPLFLAGASTE